MDIKTKKLSTKELCNFIKFDYQYFAQNPTGSYSWQISQDIQDENFLDYLQLAEEFVERVSKSKELPFNITNNLDGTDIKTLSLGEQFYNLLEHKAQKTVINTEYNQSTVPVLKSIAHQEQMDLSENYKALCDITNLHGLFRVNFSYNPYSIINESTNGLLEGELINGFVIRLREAIQRKSFKDKRNERNKLSTQRFNKAKRCIMSLYESTPHLLDVQINLCYRRPLSEDAISLLETYNHLNKFLEKLREDMSPGPLVGWCWKREYMTETGYRYHLLLFYDEQKIVNNSQEINDALSERWSSITNDQGVGYLEDITALVTYTSRMEFTLHLVQHMLMRDIYIRLKPHTKLDHFGMGSSTLTK